MYRAIPPQVVIASFLWADMLRRWRHSFGVIRKKELKRIFFQQSVTINFENKKQKKLFCISLLNGSVYLSYMFQHNKSDQSTISFHWYRYATESEIFYTFGSYPASTRFTTKAIFLFGYIKLQKQAGHASEFQLLMISIKFKKLLSKEKSCQE